MRCFIALPFPAAAREALHRSVEPLRSLWPDLAWTDPAGWHLTIAFLGEQEEAGVACARTALKATGTQSPIRFRVGRLGVFPPGGGRTGNWRVLHVGFAAAAAGPAPDRSCAEVHRLANAALVRGAAAAGLAALNPEWTEGRPFSPHLTLARVGRGAPPGLDPLESAFIPPSGEWTIGSCLLYKSELRRSGAVYTVVAEVAFEGRSGP